MAYGLTPEELQALNPRLIYVSFSGYGTDGPDADRAGFDYAAFWARSGVMGLLGEPDSSPPLCRSSQGDHTTALNLLAATLTALRLREQTGEGQVVDVTLLGTGAGTIGTDLVAALAARTQQPSLHDRQRPPNPIWSSYRCADGRWVLLVMPVPDAYWPRFCSMVGKPEWLTDPRYASLEARWQNSADLTAQIDLLFAAADSRTWWTRLDDAGIIQAPVAQMPEVVVDETLRALGAFAPSEHPTLGKYETLSAPFAVRGADIAPRGPAPTAGEHTAEVLVDAGFSDEEVANLAAAGVFG